MLTKPALHRSIPHHAAHEAHIETLVEHAFAAMDTHLARPAWVDGHSHLRRKVGDTLANRGYDAGDLVSQRHRLSDAHRAKAAMMMIM